MTELEFDLEAAEREATWLLDNPHFNERPATIDEFLGPGYLDIRDLVRPGVRKALIDIFGEEINPYRIARVREAMFTGAIGIGKTTLASIGLPYMVHWVLCLRDPQRFFKLIPGSRIAFMQMSTSEEQAAQVVFGDIFARIKHCPWFVNNYPHDPKYTKQIRFEKDIWVIPGDSAETTFEGYNILGGVLDEVNSHKVTKDKDYAEQGFNTINSRIESRFGDQGLIIVIGQLKSAVGFAADKFEEMENTEGSYTVRMTIWESYGWDNFLKDDGTRDSFWYDKRRKQIVPDGVAKAIDSENIIEIPRTYIKSFTNKPEQALRDLAGIPPMVKDPFISLVEKIDLCRNKWIERKGGDPSASDLSDYQPVDDNPTRPKFASWFRALQDPRRRTTHIDIATSGDGDALGFAMGHIHELVEIDGEEKPYIIIDCLMRIKAPAGTEIMLQEVRQYVYNLKNDRGFRIMSATLDGFQSTDTMQQFRKRKIIPEYLSVDRSTLPYEDLRDAIYEERLEFPPYLTYLIRGADHRVEIAVKELSELEDTGKKIDHPAKGSKDVADACAGVVSKLMGDRNYRKGVSSASRKKAMEETPEGPGGLEAIAPSREDFSGGLSAPPSLGSSVTGGGSLGLAIPSRLRPRR